MRLRLFILTLFFSFSGSIRADFIETNRISSVKDHVEEGTLVLFDLDNTILEPAQSLGNDSWFRYLGEKYQKEGMEKKAAVQKAALKWYAIQHVSEMKLVEEGADGVVSDLQQGGVMTMGLSTRGYGMSECTLAQLESLGIDFTKSAPAQGEEIFKNERYILFVGGSALLRWGT